MSDVMLYGVLRMPYRMAMSDEMSRYQFYQRVQEAANRLEVAESELAALKAQPAPTEVQGEDSARLDWLFSVMTLAQFCDATGFDVPFGVPTRSLRNLGDWARKEIDRARASAETGGVKS